MPELTLAGLRANNPLGYLAALGVLAVADRMRSGDVRMGWTHEVEPAAILQVGWEEAGLVDAIVEDRDRWRDSPVLDFVEGGTDPVSDVKLEPEGLRAWIDACAAVSGMARVGMGRGSDDEGRAISLLSALVADGSFMDNNRAKPTDLHFTAGQQQFLQIARELRQVVEPRDFEAALFRQWRYGDDVKSFKWDVTDDRLYAFAAVNPATDTKRTVAGAEWLALMGLVLLPVTSRPRRARTTACSGEWKGGVFTWPVWDGVLDVREAMTLLGLADLCAETVPRSLARRGVRRAYRSRITRADQGGYGSFRPPVVVLDG
jgi:hypothetical protein